MTRKKANTRYEVVREFDCSHAMDIIKDQIISLSYREKGIYRTVDTRMVV